MATHTSTPHPHGRRSATQAIARGVCVILLLTSGLWVQAPSVTWASVYQCVDHTGRRVLTNRTTGLKNCHVIVDNATRESKSSAGKNPPHENQPTDDGITPAFTDTPPQPMGSPQGRLRPWMTPPPSEIPTSVEPCVPGFNPLNPMSSVPCTQADDPQSSGPAQSR